MKLHHVLIAGLVSCVLVLAQEAATTAPAAEKAAPAKAAPAKKEAPKMVTGTISSVDAIANTVIIKGKKAEDTLTVNDKTVIKVGGKVVALADLKADTKVKASYKMEDGKKVAEKITETAAAAPAKAKAKAKDEAAAPAAAPATPAPETK